MQNFNNSRNSKSQLSEFEPIKDKRPYFTYFLVLLLIGFLSVLYYIFYYEKSHVSDSEELLPKEMVEDLGFEIPKEEIAIESEEITVENFELSESKFPKKHYIKERGNNYYVIIGSFVDFSLAEDLANKVYKEGDSVYIIEPNKENGFSYVAVSQDCTLEKANVSLSKLDKKLYHNLWVKRY